MTLPLRLELMMFNDPEIMQAAEVIQSMANEAGFDVHLQAMEFASSIQASVARRLSGVHDRLVGPGDIDGNTYAVLHSGQGNNGSHYANPDGGQAAR